MEVPGRDVTADPLGPDTETPRTDDAPSSPEVTPDDAPPTGAPDDAESGGVAGKVREVADKVKDAITPDKD